MVGGKTGDKKNKKNEHNEVDDINVDMGDDHAGFPVLNSTFSIFFIQFNVPFKIISLIETSQSIGWAKREYPGKTT